jgi:hypothetical protein
MADLEWRNDKDSNQFSCQKSVIGARGCEKCDLLETRLFNAHVELNTARLIIELLLEDVKRPGEASEGAECDIEGEPQLSSNESNRIQFQANRHAKRNAYLKEQNEMWVKSRGCMDSMFNLKDVTKPTEASESLRDFVHNVENQSNTAKYKREESAQIMNTIPVIINGTAQFNCGKVPQITPSMRVTATSCGNSKEEDNISANYMMNSKSSNLTNYVNIKDSAKIVKNLTKTVTKFC